MATVAQLMAGGIPANPANHIGNDSSTSYAAAGTNQATGTALTANFAIVTTTPSGTGVVLFNANRKVVASVYNGGLATLKVYGNATSADTINGIAGSTGLSVPTLKAAILVGSANGWIGIVSA